VADFRLPSDIGLSVHNVMLMLIAFLGAAWTRTV